MNHHQSFLPASPPGATTPPATVGKRAHTNGSGLEAKEMRVSEAVDADALSKALKEFEEGSRSREKTPSGSPSRKRQRVYGDRLAICTLRGRMYRSGACSADSGYDSLIC
jgi:hypothetical protein